MDEIDNTAETEKKEAEACAKPVEANGPPPSNAERQAAATAKAEAEKQKEAETKQTAETKETEKEGEKDGEAKKAELDTSVWGDAGDDVANSVLQTLQNSGVTPEDAKAMLWDAVQAGDPKLVDRDALVEKVGKTNATLIMAGIENVTTANNNKIAEISKIAYEAAGGEANWKKATEWAKSKLPANELDELRGMLDRGGAQAKFATQQIVTLFNNDPNNTALEAGKKAMIPDGKAGTRVQGISRVAYGQELLKLERKGGTPAEFEALRVQRQAGKKQGI